MAIDPFVAQQNGRWSPVCESIWKKQWLERQLPTGLTALDFASNTDLLTISRPCNSPELEAANTEMRDVQQRVIRRAGEKDTKGDSDFLQSRAV